MEYLDNHDCDENSKRKKSQRDLFYLCSAFHGNLHEKIRYKFSENYEFDHRSESISKAQFGYSGLTDF